MRNPDTIVKTAVLPWRTFFYIKNCLSGQAQALLFNYNSRDASCTSPILVRKDDPLLVGNQYVSSHCKACRLYKLLTELFVQNSLGTHTPINHDPIYPPDSGSGSRTSPAPCSPALRSYIPPQAAASPPQPHAGTHGRRA